MSKVVLCRLDATGAILGLPFLQKGSTGMPGVDYQAVRSLVPMSRVLELLGVGWYEQTGDQLRCGCPVHGGSAGSRACSVDLRGRFQCFKCGAKGNQLDLYAGARHLSLYAAACALCEEAGVEVPWVRRW